MANAEGLQIGPDGPFRLAGLHPQVHGHPARQSDRRGHLQQMTLPAKGADDDSVNPNRPTLMLTIRLARMPVTVPKPKRPTRRLGHTNRATAIVTGAHCGQQKQRSYGGDVAVADLP